MAWHAAHIGLNYQIMLRLECSAAERLLRAYLEAVHDSNKAAEEYLTALQQGLRDQVPQKAKVVSEVTDRMKLARQQFQLHRRKHRC